MKQQKSMCVGGVVIYLSIDLSVGRGSYSTAQMQKSEDNFPEWLLSFYHMVLGIQVRFSGLAVSTFSCWTVLLALNERKGYT